VRSGCKQKRLHGVDCESLRIHIVLLPKLDDPSTDKRISVVSREKHQLWEWERLSLLSWNKQEKYT
jgi:hypothetical protein